MRTTNHFLQFLLVPIYSMLLLTGCKYEIFTSDSGTCGPNLQWTLDYETATLSISGSGPMTSNPWNDKRRTRDHRDNPIKIVFLSEGVTMIRENAFSYCENLTTVTIPSSVTYIGYEAFTYCRGLSTIYNYAYEPPSTYIFSEVDYSHCVLFVPAESVDLYRNADGWGQFRSILPIN